MKTKKIILDTNVLYFLYSNEPNSTQYNKEKIFQIINNYDKAISSASVYEIMVKNINNVEFIKTIAKAIDETYYIETSHVFPLNGSDIKFLIYSDDEKIKDKIVQEYGRLKIQGEFFYMCIFARTIMLAFYHNMMLNEFTEQEQEKINAIHALIAAVDKKEDEQKFNKTFNKMIEAYNHGKIEQDISVVFDEFIIARSNIYITVCFGFRAAEASEEIDIVMKNYERLVPKRYKNISISRIKKEIKQFLVQKPDFFREHMNLLKIIVGDIATMHLEKIFYAWLRNDNARFKKNNIIDFVVLSQAQNNLVATFDSAIKKTIKAANAENANLLKLIEECKTNG